MDLIQGRRDCLEGLIPAPLDVYPIDFLKVTSSGTFFYFFLMLHLHSTNTTKHPLDGTH